MKVGRPGIRMPKRCDTAFFLSQLQAGADRAGESSWIKARNCALIRMIIRTLLVLIAFLICSPAQAQRRPPTLVL